MDKVLGEDVGIVSNYTSFRKAKAELIADLHIYLNQLDLKYDAHYWMFAKSDIDSVKNILNTLRPSITEVVKYMNEFDRDSLRFLRSIYNMLKKKIPISRRESFVFEFNNLEEWFKGIENFLEKEMNSIIEKRKVIENSYVRLVEEKTIREKLQVYMEECYKIGFDLNTFCKYIEKNVKPMLYLILPNDEALVELNCMMTTTSKIEEFCEDAPKSLKADIPHILADYLPDEALYKLRTLLKVSSSESFNPIPKESLTFEVFKKFLLTEKIAIPTRVLCNYVGVENDLEKYAGNKVLARKIKIVTVEEANELINSGEVSDTQLFPLMPPFDPKEPYQDFEVKNFILMSEDEKYVSSRSAQLL